MPVLCFASFPSFLVNTRVLQKGADIGKLTARVDELTNEYKELSNGYKELKNRYKELSTHNKELSTHNMELSTHIELEKNNKEMSKNYKEMSKNHKELAKKNDIVLSNLALIMQELREALDESRHREHSFAYYVKYGQKIFGDLNRIFNSTAPVFEDWYESARSARELCRGSLRARLTTTKIQKHWTDLCSKLVSPVLAFCNFSFKRPVISFGGALVTFWIGSSSVAQAAKGVCALNRFAQGCCERLVDWMWKPLKRFAHGCFEVLAKWS